jgi:phage terminase small subunit
MARPSKPTALILQEGNKLHLTKAEIEHRQSMEKALSTGDDRITESSQVKADPIAHLEFMRLKRLFSKMEYVEALDSAIISRYCLEISNAYQLQDILSRLNVDLASVEEMADRLKIYDLINKTSAILHRAKAMLIQLEDRLFLNPSTRIRAVPKTPPKDDVEMSPMARLLARGRPGRTQEVDPMEEVLSRPYPRGIPTSEK